MKITRPKSAALWLLAFVALGVSSMAQAETANYQVILKTDGTPCATYNFTITYPDDSPPPPTAQVVLNSLNKLAGCNSIPFPNPVSNVTANLEPFPETEQGGPSRVRSLDYTSNDLVLGTGGNWSITYTPGNSNNSTTESGGYFIYNTASVPIAATLPLLLLGGAGLWSARRLRRRLR